MLKEPPEGGSFLSLLRIRGCPEEQEKRTAEREPKALLPETKAFCRMSGAAQAREIKSSTCRTENIKNKSHDDGGKSKNIAAIPERRILFRMCHFIF